MTSENGNTFELGQIIETIKPPKKIQTTEYLVKGKYPIIDQSPPLVAAWTDDASALVHPPKDGLIVFGDHTCVLKFETSAFAQGADGIKIMKVRNGINAHYIYTHLKAFPLLNDGYKRHFSELKRMKIKLPCLKIQNCISEIHRIIDLKIENNKNLSITLEGIAQAIFQSWFIDFDPVKAKMAGEKPIGMDDAMGALFPDSEEESEIGAIPRGWEISQSTDLFDVLSGGTPKTTNENYWKGDIPWFSVVDAPDTGGCFFTKTNKTITKEGLDNSAAKLVRPGVTIISARGTVGKTAIVAIPSTFNQSCYGIEGKYGDFFTYLLLGNHIVNLQNISHGGMFDTITRETFSAIKVVKPHAEIIEKFESIVSPIFLKIRSLQFQSDNLASLRDSLLPRLISGELQISEEVLAS
jgi:restriction endonuclease S subunit